MFCKKKKKSFNILKIVLITSAVASIAAVIITGIAIWKKKKNIMIEISENKNSHNQSDDNLEIAETAIESAEQAVDTVSINESDENRE